MSEINFNDEAKAKLDSLLSQTDFTNVSAEGTGYSDLPEGYYLCEVNRATLTTSKASGSPMVSLQLKAIKDGVFLNDNDELATLPHTQNRVVFKNYPFNSTDDIKRFASDMMKFELEGEPILPKDAWTSSDTLIDALDLIESSSLTLWVENRKATKSREDGRPNYWATLLSWNRATQLGLSVSDDDPNLPF